LWVDAVDKVGDWRATALIPSFGPAWCAVFRSPLAGGATLTLPEAPLKQLIFTPRK
jgi:hypothetical protein